MRNVIAITVMLTVGGVLLPVGAETVITPTDPSWGTALAVDDAVVIDAGDCAVWTGTLTVKDGGSLTTRGNLSVSGATAINAGGTLTVASGTSYFAFAAGSIKGNVTVAAGAELKMNLTEAFQGASTTVFHLYGTLNCQVFRQRIDGGKFFFHDGSRVIGAGDAYGGLYAYNNSRVVFDGTVEIEPPVAGRNGYTFTVACCESAHVKFKGGIKANTSSQNTPKIVQVAATAAEGNAPGTCPNPLSRSAPAPTTGRLTSRDRLPLSRARRSRSRTPCRHLR